MEKIEASLRPRIEEAVKVVAETGQDKFWLNEALMLKNCDRCGLVPPHYLDEWKEKLKHSVIHERKKIDLLEILLRKLRFTDNAYQRKPRDACLSIPEIKKHNFYFWMAHKSKSLAAEKRLLKELKQSQNQEEEEEVDNFAVTCTSFCPQFEADIAYFQQIKVLTGKEYTSHGEHSRYLYGDEPMWWLQHQMPTLIVKEKTKNFSVSKKALQEQIKLSGRKIEESKKTILALSGQVAQAQRNLVYVDEQMTSLRKKFPAIAQRKNEAHECIIEIITKK